MKNTDELKAAIKRAKKLFPPLDDDYIGVWYHTYLMTSGRILFGREQTPRYQVELKPDENGDYHFDRSTVLWLDGEPDNAESILAELDDPKRLNWRVADVLKDEQENNENNN